MSEQNGTRVWFVTGASSGFGRAICREILDRGDRVVATSRDPESLDALGDGALTSRLDVTDPDDARAVMQKAEHDTGGVDVVVNNAGYGHIGAIEELADDELRRQLDVNLYGVINVTRAALPYFRARRSGRFVQMSSLNGIEALPGGAYYTASKFAVEGFSEALAAEVAHLGIGVTIVEPGPHRTSFASTGSMQSSTPMSAYAESVGEVRQLLAQLDGNQPGDPVRAAQVIVEMAATDHPPLRLPLGTMAHDHIRDKLRQQLDALEAVAPFGATDFPGN
ncbi:SDR family NAD(P)-dependent oxidoreductase [Kribbella pittospori]|uniref:SDR family NAD(P)-dependent oxidoreductase n=1 Tax=Kribbella pittospori TaxID=722689 RepID=A0A4R0JX56_9ACTN|nr:oxidoreductase [Kribbella pittospori]TCC52101.1 SDR family NAD(P)-dependent oxidoreductase [Kribbella pittospori]